MRTGRLARLALLSRRGCRSRAVLGRVGAVVLVGHALELFVQVGPPLLGRTDAVPVHDPHLHDSLSYQTP